MQPREKKLLMIVGGLLAVGLLIVGIRQISSAYKQRADKQTELQDSLFAQEVQIRAGVEAKKKLAELESRSLAGEVDRSKSRYQNWLLASLDKAGLQGVDVKGAPITANRRPNQPYQSMTFNVTAKGNLPQLLTWMHDFYQTGHLHLVRRLTASPIEKTKTLDLDIGIEAIVMHDAKGIDTPPQLAGRLPLGDVMAYRKIIEGRNIAGPPNHAPTLASMSRVTAKLGQPVTFTLRGKDEDPLDKVTYRIDGEAPKGATLNAASGKFSWTPPVDAEPGTVSVKVIAEDDGLPAKIATQTVTIQIERLGLKLASISNQKLDVGKSFSTTPRFLEHDAKRAKSFELKGTTPEGLTFDAKTGAIKWTPGEEAAGKNYRLSLIATDDATPPNKDEKRFEISVLEPVVPQLELDFAAQRTYLTALLDVDGRAEAWFQVRPTGERIVLVLPEGPEPQNVELRAGNFVGKLIEIDFDGDLVVLESLGKRLVLYRGKSLADAAAATATAKGP